MKIAVNTRLLRKNQMDGIGWVGYNFLKNIVLKHPETEFHFFFDSKNYDDFLFAENVFPYCLFPPAKHAVLNIIWFEWSVKRKLKKIKPDLFFSPDGIACLGWKGRQLVIIHDLNFIHRPADLKLSNKIYYNYFISRSARSAAHIATVSAYSKADINSTYKIPLSKIDVVYPAINEHFNTYPYSKNILVKYGLKKKDIYFIFIGALHPRKNILNLVSAFIQFKQASNSKTKLVLAGKAMYKSDEIYILCEGSEYKNDIIFPGRVNDEDIASLLSYALALVFVPFFEGFGLPVLEAMECKVPVICSNTTSLPEVAGNAALLVNPNSSEQISQAMYNIYKDDNMKNDLIAKGLIQKKKFSWAASSKKLWNIMTDIAAGR